eukprot:3729892-Ditylum_brightwellii.AAC.1
MAAEHIWGPDVGCLQGKTVRRPGLAIRHRTLGVLMNILENHMEVTIVADILTVNKVRFFVSMSRHLKFITGEYITNAYDSTLLKIIESVKRAYMQRGFMEKHMMMDNQFECLREQLTMKQISLIVCPEDEHMGV